MTMRTLAGALLSATAAALIAVSANAVAAAGDTTPAIDVAAIDAAVKTLREDPDLSGEKTERRLRWKDEKQKDIKPDPTPAWLKWIEGFFKWLNEAGRVLVWVLGGISVVLVLLAIKRWLDVRGDAVRRARLSLPTHVRDLDIRPESLPDDIGAAAWQRWRAATDWTARRAALSLLYRGALSRLVHVHAVPIRASSTEGECVALACEAMARAGGAAAGERVRYVGQLVDVWQRAVYGLRTPGDDTVQALCLQFGPALNAPVPMAVAAQPNSAPA